MYKPFIYPIIPRPIHVDTEHVKGKLLIEGNMEYNYIRLRFCFENVSETAPLAISVEAKGKEYVFNCILMDFEKYEVRTVTFHPEFNINQRFNIVNVDPLVKFVRKEQLF